MKRRTLLAGAAAGLALPFIPNWIPPPLKQFWVTQRADVQWIHVYKPQDRLGVLYVPLNNGYGADFTPDTVLTIDQFLEGGFVNDCRLNRPEMRAVGRPTDAWIDKPTMTLVARVQFFDCFRGFEHPSGTPNILSGVGGVVSETENLWTTDQTIIRRADIREVLLFQPK